MPRRILDRGTRSQAAVDPNDWDRHWLDFSESVEDNPAQAFRRRVVDQLLGPIPSGARILDIGSGQGDMAVHLKARHPIAAFLGLELSATGVDVSRRKVPSAAFLQRDLCSEQSTPPEFAHWATHAVCSEVLEHVDEPRLLLQTALTYCAPRCRLVVTVPGGPMSKLDHHIGHRHHYTPTQLRTLLLSAGLDVEWVGSRGFPFFNLYRLTIVVRGERLVEDVAPAGGGRASMTARLAMKVFQGLLTIPTPLPIMGWQIVGVARVR